MQIGEYIIKPELIREDHSCRYYLCHHQDNEQSIFTCKVIDKTQLTAHESIKLNAFLENYSPDVYEVFFDNNEYSHLIYVIQKIENAGLSLKQILDLKGHLEEEEVRVVLTKLAFVIRVLYMHNSYPRKFDIGNIYLQVNDDDFFIAEQQSPMMSKRIQKMKFQKLRLTDSDDSIISVYINDIIYLNQREEVKGVREMEGQGYFTVDGNGGCVGGSPNMRGPSIPREFVDNYVADIQNLGILYFELLTGIHPVKYMKKLSAGKNPKVRYNSNTQHIFVSSLGLRFMKKCLKFDLSKHKSMTKKIIQHKFLERKANEMTFISFSELLNFFNKFYRKTERVVHDSTVMLFNEVSPQHQPLRKNRNQTSSERRRNLENRSSERRKFAASIEKSSVEQEKKDPSLFSFSTAHEENEEAKMLIEEYYQEIEKEFQSQGPQDQSSEVSAQKEQYILGNTSQDLQGFETINQQEAEEHIETQTDYDNLTASFIEKVHIKQDLSQYFIIDRQLPILLSIYGHYYYFFRKVYLHEYMRVLMDFTPPQRQQFSYFTCKYLMNLNKPTLNAIKRLEYMHQSLLPKETQQKNVFFNFKLQSIFDRRFYWRELAAKYYDKDILNRSLKREDKIAYYKLWDLYQQEKTMKLMSDQL